MRNGTCSKCGKATVYTAQNALKFGDQPHAVLFPNRQDIRSGFNTDGIWQFACVTCGYLEIHVLDEKALEFMRKRWEPVPAQ